MSSPTSASSSAVSNDDLLQQQTKDKRRERNRLAAQKHRLRRNQRMSQLEQQVLSLQQEKNALLSRVDPLAPPPPTVTVHSLSPPALDDAWLDDCDPDDDLDSPRRKRSRITSGSLAPESEPAPAPPLDDPYDARRRAPRSAVSPPAHDLVYPLKTPSSAPSAPPSSVFSASGSRAESSSSEYEPRHSHGHHPLRHSHIPHHSNVHGDTHTARLEERILELERWTEDLNGSLTEALDAEDHLKSQLATANRHADTQAQRYSDAVHAYQVDVAAKQREIDRLRARLESLQTVASGSDVRSPNGNAEHIIADLQSRLRSDAAVIQQQKAEMSRLRERLESSELTLELQRRASASRSGPRPASPLAPTDRTSAGAGYDEHWQAASPSQQRTSAGCVPEDTKPGNRDASLTADDVATIRWELRQLRAKALQWEDAVVRLSHCPPTSPPLRPNSGGSQVRVDAAESEARALRERLHSLQSTVDGSEDARRALEHANVRLEDERAALAEERAGLLAQRGALQRENARLADSVDEMRETLRAQEDADMA